MLRDGQTTTRTGAPPSTVDSIDVFVDVDKFGPVAVISDDFERVWAGRIGPTCVLAARRLVTDAGLVMALDGRTGPGLPVSIGGLAGQLGVTPSKARAALDRLTRFGLAEWRAGWSLAELVVRWWPPRLPSGYLERMADVDRDVYERALAGWDQEGGG